MDTILTVKPPRGSPRGGFTWQLVGRLGKLLVDLLCGTLRIRVEGYELVRPEIESKRFVLAFWHSRILMVSYMHQGLGGAILVSSSKDGEIAARILQRQGHDTIRGSSSRHGVRALAGLIKALQEKSRPGAVVPDGPRGPRFKVQAGVITLARKTGYPIVPITYGARRIKVFASWDRFILPCPFTECCVIYGAPLRVPADADAQAQEVLRQKLEEQLQEITRSADLRWGHVID